MTKNPYINSVLAVLYISGVVSLMNFGEKWAKPVNEMFIGIAMISLFTLSAAVMAYLFLYQPIQLYMDGKKKVAVNFFLKTLGGFALFTATIFTLLFLRVF